MIKRATKTFAADAASIREAAEALRGGGLVAFPTETVYGLGADAENDAAMRALFAAKGRPADHPVIVHVHKAAQIERYAAEVPPAARELAAAFWPGPMTLVLRRSTPISNLVTGGLDTVGIRVPSHPVAQALLQAFGGPIAAPSANRFGRVSCTRAEHVEQELAGHIDLILDGGECQVGIESTIIDVSSPRVAVLRPGAVTAEQISTLLGKPVSAPSAAAPRVSGGLPSHYAPLARVEIVAPHDLEQQAMRLTAAGELVAIISDQALFMPRPGIVVLAVPSGETELAHALYSLLRRADELKCDVVLTTLPIEQGLGAAIADRLRRAAGPRESRQA